MQSSAEFSLGGKHRMIPDDPHSSFVHARTVEWPVRSSAQVTRLLMRDSFHLRVLVTSMNELIVVNRLQLLVAVVAGATVFKRTFLIF